MSLLLHVYKICPFCRPVLMLDKYLDLGLELKEYDTMKKEHMIPEFLKLNPQHSVPTLQDHDLTIWESVIVLSYLAEKFQKNEELYPRDLKKRSLVQLRTQFALGTLMPRFISAYIIPMKSGSKQIDPEKVKNVHEALQWLEGYLNNSKYFVGDNVTIADFALLSVIRTLEHYGTKMSSYSNIQKWFRLAKEVKGYQETMELGFEVKPELLFE